MFLNNWHVACTSEELKAAPFQTRMLGCDFVLFRDEKGEAVCLSDVCCHRGASLSKGTYVGGSIACPYHGWHFNSEGRCVRIPALGEDMKIPRRARVDRYPVKEWHGWVWVFLGDAPEDERPAMFDDSFWPDYVDFGTWRGQHTMYEAPVNFARTVENSIDTAHPSFVHRSFGSKRDPKSVLVPIEESDWWARATRERTPPDRAQKRGMMHEITPETRGKTWASTTIFFTGYTTRVEIRRADGPAHCTMNTRTPVDELNVRVYGIQWRNYMLSPEGDEDRVAGRMSAIAEDVGICSTVRPRLTPRSTSEELFVESDQLESAFRRLMKRMQDKGWEIDTDTIDAERKRRQYVIPSPLRREDPHNWVHRAVPRYQPAS